MKKNFLVRLILSGGIITTIFFVILIIIILMFFNFFGVKIIDTTVENNYEYADEYTRVLNNNLKDGYVPLIRILYFYLEDNSLSFDELYKINLDTDTKSLKNIDIVCEEELVKNLNACTEINIEENIDFLNVGTGIFNFPLKNNDYSITSFYKKERVVFEEYDIHNGWDFSSNANTPVYSVCNGVVDKINFNQQTNQTCKNCGGGYGNYITIKCDEDTENIFYVTFAHLFPNSNKVNIGDRVNHWTHIAGVGTTGSSTGNHLHFQVNDKDNNLIDGMQLVNYSFFES